MSKKKQDQLLTEAEVAKRLGVSERLVRSMRVAGTGPKHVLTVMGNQIRYKLSDVLAFEDGGLLKQEDLANRWGLSLRSVQQRDSAREIPGRVMLGRFVRFRLNQIVAYETATKNPD